MFTQPTLIFLTDLAENNNREWFTTNRKRYDNAKKELENIVAQSLAGLAAFESWPQTEVKDCIFRINRDVRFSKNKDPYKKHLSAAFGPGGRHSGRIDYYLHIQPSGESLLGAGMWNPTPQQLAKFRQELDFNPAELKNIIDTPTFKSYFPQTWGESLSRIPKGYDEKHPEAELLKRKQLFFMHKFSDEEIVNPDFAANFVNGCAIIKPYCDYLNYLFYDDQEEEIKL